MLPTPETHTCSNWEQIHPIAADAGLGERRNNRKENASANEHYKRH